MFPPDSFLYRHEKIGRLGVASFCCRNRAEITVVICEQKPSLRVSNKFFGMRDFPYLRLGIQDFKAKSGDSGLKVCAGGVVRKITLGITGLPEILGRDYGI